MFKNYLTIAIRNIARYKVYSFINIAGLAIGMACCALILLYVQHELSYDVFHSKSDRIYRVLRETQNDDGSLMIHPGISGTFAPALLKDFPEVQNAGRVMGFILTTWYTYNGQKHKESIGTVFLAEPHFMSMFDFEWIQGDPTTALRDPYSVVMTTKTAKRYFGQDDPMGKIITSESPDFSGDFKVAGIVQIPENSSMQFTMLFPVTSALKNSWMRRRWEHWDPTYQLRPFQTFIVLREGEDSEVLEAKLPDFMEQHMGKEIRAKNTYRLQPLNRMHLYMGTDYGQKQGWDSILISRSHIQTIYLFSGVAFLILLIACVNFMNLSTARSSNRAKEVGLRKVTGAHRFQLIRQFLGESILLSALALIITMGLVELSLPTFNAFVGKNLTLQFNAYHVLLVPGIVVLVGLLAGCYPAFFLSAFAPIAVLTGRLQTGQRGILFRKGLVVFQFAMSILLIVGTIMAYRQLNYMQTKQLGFNKEHLIVAPIFKIDKAVNGSGYTRTNRTKRLDLSYHTVKQAFLAHPDILRTSAYRVDMRTGGYERQVHLKDGDTYQVLNQEADEDFLDTFELELIEGRNFSSTLTGADIRNYEVLVNETAVRIFGWENPIGKQIQTHISAREGNWAGIGTVVGIVKDFHNRSLHEKIRPLVITNRVQFDLLALRVRGENVQEVIAFLEDSWKNFMPGFPLEFVFVDESLNQMYREDHKIGQLVGTFALLAILVACLGLFGLAAFTAEQRTKEIGVRKILGASTKSIVLLLSKEFAKLVLIANLIAWPVAYFAIGNWLQNFAYRVDVSWWVFALGGILTLLIALLTVGYQAIRAALANPIEALRYE